MASSGEKSLAVGHIADFQIDPKKNSTGPGNFCLTGVVSFSRAHLTCFQPFGPADTYD
jgi:hypothetical protein